MTHNNNIISEHSATGGLTTAGSPTSPTYGLTVDVKGGAQPRPRQPPPLLSPREKIQQHQQQRQQQHQQQQLQIVHNSNTTVSHAPYHRAHSSSGSRGILSHSTSPAVTPNHSRTVGRKTMLSATAASSSSLSASPRPIVAGGVVQFQVPSSPRGDPTASKRSSYQRSTPVSPSSVSIASSSNPIRALRHFASSGHNTPVVSTLAFDGHGAFVVDVRSSVAPGGAPSGRDAFSDDDDQKMSTVVVDGGAAATARGTTSLMSTSDGDDDDSDDDDDIFSAFSAVSLEGSSASSGGVHHRRLASPLQPDDTPVPRTHSNGTTASSNSPASSGIHDAARHQRKGRVVVLDNDEGNVVEQSPSSPLRGHNQRSSAGSMAALLDASISRTGRGGHANLPAVSIDLAMSVQAHRRRQQQHPQHRPSTIAPSSSIQSIASTASRRATHAGGTALQPEEDNHMDRTSHFTPVAPQLLSIESYRQRTTGGHATAAPQQALTAAPLRAMLSSSSADDATAALSHFSSNDDDDDSDSDAVSGNDFLSPAAPQLTTTVTAGSQATSQTPRARAIQRRAQEREEREQKLLRSRERQANAVERKMFLAEHRHLQLSASWLTFVELARSAMRLTAASTFAKMLRERRARRGIGPLVALRMRQLLRRARTRLQGRGVPRPTVAMLRADKLLNLFPDAQLQHAIDRMTLKYFFENENIIMMGSEDDEAYVLHSGVADVLMGDVKVFTMRSGMCFGTVGMISGEPRTASIVARERDGCLAWVLTRAVFSGWGGGAEDTQKIAAAHAAINELRQQNMMNVYKKQLDPSTLGYYPMLSGVAHETLTSITTTSTRPRVVRAGTVLSAPNAPLTQSQPFILLRGSVCVKVDQKSWAGRANSYYSYPLHEQLRMLYDVPQRKPRGGGAAALPVVMHGFSELSAIVPKQPHHAKDFVDTTVELLLAKEEQHHRDQQQRLQANIHNAQHQQQRQSSLFAPSSHESVSPPPSLVAQHPLQRSGTMPPSLSASVSASTHQRTSPLPQVLSTGEMSMSMPSGLSRSDHPFAGPGHATTSKVAASRALSPSSPRSLSRADPQRESSSSNAVTPAAVLSSQLVDYTLTCVLFEVHAPAMFQLAPTVLAHAAAPPFTVEASTDCDLLGIGRENLRGQDVLELATLRQNGLNLHCDFVRVPSRAEFAKILCSVDDAHLQTGGSSTESSAASIYFASTLTSVATKLATTGNAGGPVSRRGSIATPYQQQTSTKRAAGALNNRGTQLADACPYESFVYGANDYLTFDPQSDFKIHIVLSGEIDPTSFRGGRTSVEAGGGPFVWPPMAFAWFGTRNLVARTKTQLDTIRIERKHLIAFVCREILHEYLADNGGVHAMATTHSSSQQQGAKTSPQHELLHNYCKYLAVEFVKATQAVPVFSNFGFDVGGSFGLSDHGAPSTKSFATSALLGNRTFNAASSTKSGGGGAAGGLMRSDSNVHSRGGGGGASIGTSFEGGAMMQQPLWLDILQALTTSAASVARKTLQHMSTSSQAATTTYSIGGSTSSAVSPSSGGGGGSRVGGGGRDEPQAATDSGTPNNTSTGTSAGHSPAKRIAGAPPLTMLSMAASITRSGDPARDPSVSMLSATRSQLAGNAAGLVSQEASFLIAVSAPPPPPLHTTTGGPSSPRSTVVPAHVRSPLGSPTITTPPGLDKFTTVQGNKGPSPPQQLLQQHPQTHPKSSRTASPSLNVYRQRPSTGGGGAFRRAKTTSSDPNSSSPPSWPATTRDVGSVDGNLHHSNNNNNNNQRSTRTPSSNSTSKSSCTNSLVTPSSSMMAQNFLVEAIMKGGKVNLPRENALFIDNGSTPRGEDSATGKRPAPVHHRAPSGGLGRPRKA